MYSLLQSPEKESSAPASQTLSSTIGPTETEFDRSGSNSITAGCFLGPIAAPAVLPRASGAVSPEALSTSDAWAVPDHANTRDRHDTRLTIHKTTARSLDGSGTIESPAVKRCKRPTLDPTDTQKGVPEFSFVNPTSDENRVPETPVASASPRSEKPWPDEVGGSASLPSKGNNGVDISRPGVYEVFQASPVVGSGTINTKLRAPPALSSNNTLLPSSKDISYVTSFQVPGSTSFLMKKGTLPDEYTGSVHIPVQNRCRPPYSGFRQPPPQQQQQTVKGDEIPRLKPEHANIKGPQAPSDQPFPSRQLDGIIAAYSSNHQAVPMLPAGSAAAASKQETSVTRKRGAKRTRLGGGGARGDTGGQASPNKARVGVGKPVALDISGGSGRTTGWRQTCGSSAAVAAATKAAERTKQLEALMNAAMESPITYEEQVRRERLAHLRVMYTVRKPWLIMTKHTLGHEFVVGEVVVAPVGLLLGA